jgi:hypothetical protein
MASSSQFGRNSGTDPLRTTLGQIPTVFGRLVYLASLFNATSGAYEHEGFGQAFGAQEADRVLRQHHHEVFSQWLGSSLEEQKRDLDEFLAGAPLASGRMLYDLNQLAPYRVLIPPAARAVERQLYLTDLETLLELLRFE